MRIGLVGRESNPRDARLALVTLTDAGRRVAGEAAATVEEAAATILARLWPDTGDRTRVSELPAAVR